MGLTTNPDALPGTEPDPPVGDTWLRRKVSPFQRTTLAAFYKSCKKENDCIRCGTLVNKDNEEWSTIGQAVKRDKIVGGVLCESCGKNFLMWMKEGGLDNG